MKAPSQERTGSSELATADGLRSGEQPTPPQGPIGTPEDAADYLVDMIRELEEVARRHGHKVLGQILEIAYQEARRAMPPGADDRGAAG